MWPACPASSAASYAMPDAHWGYGFPIGGVAAFDPAEGGVVSAGGVGFDISCGVRTLHTGLTRDEVMSVQKALADVLFRRIPAGLGSTGHIHLSRREMDRMLVEGARWAVAQGYGEDRDLFRIEEQGRMSGADPSQVSEKAKTRQQNEMGTLGSGNHYLEVQAVTAIYDAAIARTYGLAEDDVVVSIHCGSRGLGHQVGTEFLKRMLLAAGHVRHPVAGPGARLRPHRLPDRSKLPGGHARGHQLRAGQPPDPHPSDAPGVRRDPAQGPNRSPLRRVPQHLQGRGARGGGTQAATVHPPQGGDPRFWTWAQRGARAPAHRRPAGTHRRHHGHCVLRARRHQGKRRAGLQFRVPRRRASDEPARGQAPVERTLRDRRLVPPRHSDPQPQPARSGGGGARCLQGRGRSGIEAADTAGLARKVARLEPLVCIKG